MRTTQLRQADLNLLVVFAVLAEERNISRAAKRLLLSQPAVTRALQRLREMFQDDLLIRVSNHYELTPKGDNLLREVEMVLPRIDRLLAGGKFMPAKEKANFRLAGTDYASQIIGIPLAKELRSAGPHLSFAFLPMSNECFEELDHGRIDLLFRADDGRVPSHCSREMIFEEDFACVVANKSPFSKGITQKQYLVAPHVLIDTLGGIQTIPDQRLSASGLKRRVEFTFSYFHVAMSMVASTDLVATVPRRMALVYNNNPELKIVRAPPPMSRFTYLMVWHPRMESDAAHMWLRSTVRRVGEAVSQRT